MNTKNILTVYFPIWVEIQMQTAFNLSKLLEHSDKYGAGELRYTTIILVNSIVFFLRMPEKD